MYRRNFLATGIATGITLATAAAESGEGRNRDIRVGVIGVRGRGREHLHFLNENVAAICDVDLLVLEREAKGHRERVGKGVATYTDYRELLGRPEIDAVTIATPNHTHSLIAIAAIEAGKDVYVEKPVSHNIWEGRQLVAAADKHDRIVQCGTQSRSSPSLIEAAKWLRAGSLGRIEYAIGTCYKPRGPIGKREDPLPIPSTIDYDLWCGPAERREIFRSSLHYDWHWDWNTGNGDTGNQGVHQVDIARWFLGEDRVPPRVLSIGGRLGYEDAGDTPNTQTVFFDYPSAPLIFETRGLPRSKAAQARWGRAMSRYRGSVVGVVVQCEAGHMLIPSYTDAIAYDKQGREIRRWEGGGDHFANWLAAITTRDAAILNAKIREGHLSSVLCHIAGVSYLTGQRKRADEISDEIAHNALLSSSFCRMAEHLRANEVRVDTTRDCLTLGTPLVVDPVTENFVNNPSASGYFSREYRSPYQVPDYGA